MNGEQFKGIFPYLVTPLDENGNVKEEVLAGLVDHLIRKGVHGLTPPWGVPEREYILIGRPKKEL